MMRFSPLLLLLAGACAGVPVPVPVNAPQEDLAALAGEWTGSYESPATGRSGSIVFNLQAGADTASGDVIMTPRGSSVPLSSSPNPGMGRPTDSGRQVLTIRFVQAAGGTVTGALDPYRDPDCDCILRTTFQGQLQGDRIRGTFESEGLPSGLVGGSWSVRRSR